MKKYMPAIFMGHGSPMSAIEDTSYRRKWIELGKYLEAEYEKPKAILVFSAHFASRETIILDRDSLQQIYDMYGFPPELYELKYQAHGSHELALKLSKLLDKHNISHLLDSKLDDKSIWGIDHGIWSVLSAVYPKADVPLVIVSTNVAQDDPKHATNLAFKLGKAVRELRREGVLIFGTGNIVHNLYAYQAGLHMEDAAKHFDGEIETILKNRDDEALLSWHEFDGAKLAAPTLEHFLPMISTYAASSSDDTLVTYIKESDFGPISMTSYMWE